MTYERVWRRREQARKRLIPLELGGGGGGSWSIRIAEFLNVLRDRKRVIGEIGRKAEVQVQNRYSGTGRSRAETIGLSIQELVYWLSVDDAGQAPDPARQCAP